MTFHYTLCGLDNVWLLNGYQIHNTKYGEGISIDNVEGLHRLIGEWLIDLPKPLNGAELRYLRTELGLPQRQLADFLGAKEQTLRLWEKHRKKAIPGPADRLLRALYAEFINEDGTVRRMVERLAELDLVDNPRMCAREIGSGWQEDRPAA